MSILNDKFTSVHFYSVSWIRKEKIVAKAVGMETESGLSVGWRQIKD